MKKLLNLSLRHRGAFHTLVCRMLLCLMLMMSTLSAVAGEPVKPEGSGTEEDPYAIGTIEEFMWFAELIKDGSTFSDRYLFLTSDIDLSSVCHPADESRGIEEKSWESIVKFQGTLDGQGHTIKNLYQHNISKYGGLFREMFGKIKNLELTNVDISYDNSNVVIEACGALASYINGKLENCSASGIINISACNRSSWYDGVGGLVGCCDNYTWYYNGMSVPSYYSCEIIGCTNNVIVNHIDLHVGGIMGSNNGHSTIICCINNANIKSVGIGRVGGIIGYNENITMIRSCQNNGNITGDSTVGGIEGGGSAQCYDCINTGIIKGTSYVGGIMGDARTTCITNCLNTGDVICTSANGRGGLIAVLTFRAIENCYYSTTCQLIINGQAVPLCADYNHEDDFGVTAAQLKSGEVTYWLQNRRDTVFWKQHLSVDKIPVLNLDYTNQEYRVVKTDTIDCRGISVGIGTYQNGDDYNIYHRPHDLRDDFCVICHQGMSPRFEDGVYKITSMGNLKWFRDAVNSESPELKTQNVELRANIDLALLYKYIDEEWKAIGTSSALYSGTFDGKGHTISNLSYNNNKDTKHNGGLFGNLYNATIRDVKIIGNSVCQTGGLLAYSANKCKLSKVYVAGSMTCSTEGAGGMIAVGDRNEIDYCASHVDVKGTRAVGGLIGKTNTSGNELFYCASYGTLTGTSNVGGLIGSEQGDVITNSVCYSPRGSQFFGCYYTEEGIQVSQTQEEMNNGTTLEAMQDANWFQEPEDVAPVLGDLEGFKLYYLNCQDAEIAEPACAYFSRNESEVRYYHGDGHRYVDEQCEFCELLNSDADGYFLVSRPKHLLWLDKHFQPGDEYHIRQVADIDLSSVCYPGNRFKLEVNWKPILTGCYGVYDGQGHTIKGLYISNASMHEPGPASFFGFAGVNGATYDQGKLVLIKDLTIEGRLTTKRSAGMFASEAQLAIFQNCTARGSISVVSDMNENYAGGICGRNYYGLFVECKNEATIEATANQQAGNYFGGIAGLNGNFYGCSNEGDITIRGGYAGGIAGNPSYYTMEGSIAEEVIAYCCNTGNVTGVNQNEYGLSSVGGLVGYVSHNMHMCCSWVSADLEVDYTALNTSTQFVYKRLYGSLASSSVELGTLNCYLNKDKKIGNDKTIGNRSTADFNSGKVAFELGYPWGQNLSGSNNDLYPVLRGPMVIYRSSSYTNEEKYNVSHILRLLSLAKFGMNFEQEIEHIQECILQQ